MQKTAVGSDHRTTVDGKGKGKGKGIANPDSGPDDSDAMDNGCGNIHSANGALNGYPDKGKGKSPMAYGNVDSSEEE